MHVCLHLVRLLFCVCMDLTLSQLMQHQHDDNILKQQPGMHLKGDCSSLLVTNSLHEVTAGTVHHVTGIWQECVNVQMLALLQHESILIPVLALSSRIVMGMPTPMLSWVTTMRPWLGYLAAALQPSQNACLLSICCYSYATQASASGSMCKRSKVGRGT